MRKLSVNKIKAVILGHAVADALGVPVEFSSREELDESPVTDMEGFGTYPYPAGCWSDDTSMTLCALHSLSDGELNFDDIMQNFGKWYYKDEFTPTGELFDVGNACSTAIDNYFKKHLDAENCGLKGENSNGNGSLMRILPFSLLFPNDYEVIYKASALTHAHLRSKMACLIYTMVLNEILSNNSKEAVIRGIEKAKAFYEEEPEWEYFERLPIIDIHTNIMTKTLAKPKYVKQSATSISISLSKNKMPNCFKNGLMKLFIIMKN